MVRTGIQLSFAVLLAGLLIGGWLLRDRWPASSAAHDSDVIAAAGAAPTQVKLSEQAQKNLKLIAKPLIVDSYWRTIQVPGTVVDRPAQSDRGVVAPITGVVTEVFRFPGDIVKSGEPLFTLRLLSDNLHTMQTDLFKAVQETQSLQEQRKRLSANPGSVPESRLIEIDNQLRRLSASIFAGKQELLNRGLAQQQVDAVLQGQLVADIQLLAPNRSADSSGVSPTWELKELKIELGQQVQAGQMLATLSNHQSLYIEGRAFPQETALIERAARESWPIQVEMMEGNGDWPSQMPPITIRHVANNIDPTSRTFPFYLQLHNESHSYQKDGKTLLLWRFRPGQRVRLNIPADKWDNVFVVPADAVVREGPESYVFRQNGDIFERKPVHVVHQNRQHAVIANDGAILPGGFVVQGGATQINRVLKSQTGGLPAGFHMHADGSIHSNSAH